MGNQGQKYEVGMNMNIKNHKRKERVEIDEKEIKCDEQAS